MIKAAPTLSLCAFLNILFASCRHDNASIYEPPDITSGLVANIALDGNGLDSVSGVSGIVNQASPCLNRHTLPGKAMQFLRVDSAFIDFGDLEAVTFTGNVFTIACWVKPYDTLSSMAVLSKRNPFGPFEYSLDNHFAPGNLSFDNWTPDGGSTIYGVDPLNASAGIQPGEWTHIAFTGDGAKLNVYLDGFLMPGSDTYNPGKDFGNTGAAFVIGNGGGWGKNYYFNGEIDDIRIYDRVLDKKAIKYLAER